MKHYFISYFIPHFILLFALIVSGCQSGANVAVKTNGNENSAVKSEKLKIEQVVKAFKAANLPLGQLEFFNAASDPQKLLGKPNQYVEKAIWQTTAEMVHNIEAFAGDADLQARKTALEAASKTAASPAAYVYAHKNILLRIHHKMLPETAARYEQALKSL